MEHAAHRRLLSGAMPVGHAATHTPALLNCRHALQLDADAPVQPPKHWAWQGMQERERGALSRNVLAAHVETHAVITGSQNA